ncbi:hypothetical protein ACH5RR_037894 [Cinchona calisaya]|uniref:Bifunctional inhibitor/plant lipid transfer protein/seed storage helical domain-containing protein n=1 Tax=Cinchona calisaya TaxID=153742 RepID=A0ABD2YB57_9GENT
MQMMQMRQCKNYLMSQMGQGGPFNRVAIKMMVDGDNNQMGLQQCCMELRNVDDECRCEVIKQMVMQQMQEGQMEQGQQQMQKMMQMARNLPAMCNMQPYQCQF